MSGRTTIRRLVSTALLLLSGPAVFAGPHESARGQRFPQLRPSTRADAIAALRDEQVEQRSCLTPEIQLAVAGPGEMTRETARALGLLRRGIPFGAEQTVAGPDGITVRYSTAPSAFNHTETTDPRGAELPDALEATLRGIEEARGLLNERLELPRPENLVVLLVELGDGLDGYVVPTLERWPRIAIMLDASPRGGAAGARRAAIHQYAHAVAMATGTGLPAVWAEALATWTVLALDGGLDEETAAHIDRRLRQLHTGLLDHDLRLASGNAVWFAFIEEAYGPGTVRLTVDELARDGASVTAALDRALRRSAGVDLEAAFREFQLWTFFTGAHDDGHHFSFAGQLVSPVFASTADGLPALSVQADRPVGPWGAALVRIEPGNAEGGLRINFEGEIPGRWEADLLLVGAGPAHRLALAPSEQGRAERTVPLDGLAEAVLLIRNLNGDEAAAHRYTYAAQHERGFPFELAALGATRLDPGVLVAWETAAETKLVGFNILRRRAVGGQVVTVNPVWIPALGDWDLSTSYRFFDATAEPDAAYVYRIQGITEDGLTARSEAVTVGPAHGVRP